MSALHLTLTISLFLCIVLIPFEIRFKGGKDKISNFIIPILMLLASAFIVISLIRFDPSSGFEANRSINAGGLIGFYIAWYSYIAMGITAGLIAPLLIYGALGFLINFDKDYFPSVFSAAVLALTPLFVRIISSNQDISGIYGYYAADFLAKYLGKAGLLVIIVFAYAAVLLLLTDIKGIMANLIRKIREMKSETVPDISEKPRKKKPKAEKPPENRKKEKKREVTIRTAFETNIDYSEIINDSFQELFLEQLEDPPQTKITADKEFINENIQVLEEKLRSFQVEGKVINVSIGPVITTYEFEPSPGIKVNKITSLSDDLALAMKAKSIRILGHIPGKSAVGIEIPNRKRIFVYLKNLLTDEVFVKDENPTAIVIGRDTENTPIYERISDMPHLLIAGTTGSGKSVCINSLITSILFRSQPEQVRFLMVDPKRIELSVYNGIPHLERPVITEPQEAITMLKELSEWMDIRYTEFAKLNVRNIDEYNKKSKKKKPYIVVIIDEMADLMMTASREIEYYVTRLAQMSRAVGIHLILATQRPSVNIITGSIKANFPIRISFKVPSKADSKTILDTVGAEKLLGKGDMLFIPPQKGTASRVHGAFLKTEEVTDIVNLWAKKYMITLFKDTVKDSEKLADLIIENELIQCIANRDGSPAVTERIAMFINAYADELEIEPEELKAILQGIQYHIPIEESVITENIRNKTDSGETDNGDMDTLFEAAKDYVIMKGKASTSMLQRHFGIGYPRAARIIEQLEESGVIGTQNGSKPREVFYDSD